jgi:copper chaperone CopZ
MKFRSMFTVFAVVSLIITGCGTTEEGSSTEKSSDVTATQVYSASEEFKVTGMCAVTVRDELEKLDGVSSVEMGEYTKDHTSLAKVQFDPDKIRLEQLHKTVVDLGFSVE